MGAKNSTESEDLIEYYESINRVYAYIPLVLIIVGVLGNLTCLILFTVKKELKQYSSMVLLSFIAVVDTLNLWVWNFNHFISTIIHSDLEFLNVYACKILSFMQYSTLHSSGLLYSMVCIDRYFTVISKPGSFVSKLPFGSRRAALIWSIIIIICMMGLNIPILIYNGYVIETTTNTTSVAYYVTNNANESVPVYQTETSFEVVCYDSLEMPIFRIWDMLNVIVYTFIPSGLMVLFNALLIINVFYSRAKKQMDKNSASANRKKLRLTISLIIITFSFILMTTPGVINYAYFFPILGSSGEGRLVLTICDSIMFAQNVMLFPISFLTNRTFSRIVRDLVGSLFTVCCKKSSKKNKESKHVKSLQTKSTNADLK